VLLFHKTRCDRAMVGGGGVLTVEGTRELLVGATDSSATTCILITQSFPVLCSKLDRLCGLVVRVSGYRYRGPGFDPRRYQIF